MPPDVEQAKRLASLIIPFTYKGLSDEDMAAYIAFLESDAGSTLQRAMNTAIQQALRSAYLELIKTLEAIYKRDHPHTILPY